MKTVSVNWVIGQILATCQSLVNAHSPDFPGSLYFNKFYTFLPLSRSQWNMYKFVWRTYIYWLTKYLKIIWWYDGNTWNWSIVQITYTFWEQFVIRLRTSMILFKTGDSIPLIYSIKCMCGRLLYLLMNLKETFICISHTCSHSTLCDCDVTV